MVGDEKFLDAFDRRESERIQSGIAAIIGHNLPDAEVERVEAIIARDKRDRARELDRKQAEMELAAGVYVNLSDAVIEPTPEWLAKFDTVRFTPRQPDGTVRTVKGTRMVATSLTTRMNKAGRLTDEQSAACDWYRNCYEVAGLAGRYKTSNFGEAGGSGNGLACAPIAQHAREAEAREAFREARKALPAHLLRGFDAVVLGDLPLRRAARFIRSDNSKMYRLFSDVCSKLVAWCESNGIEFT